MNTQQIFTKDNLKVLDVEYRASASGDGIIYLNLDSGTIEVDVESCLDEIEITNYGFSSHITKDNKVYYRYLDDQSIEAVSEYMKENSIFDKYMDEVYEAVSQTF